MLSGKLSLWAFVHDAAAPSSNQLDSKKVAPCLAYNSDCVFLCYLTPTLPLLCVACMLTHQDMELELKHACEQFITEQTTVLIGPLVTLVAKLIDATTAPAMLAQPESTLGTWNTSGMPACTSQSTPTDRKCCSCAFLLILSIVLIVLIVLLVLCMCACACVWVCTPARICAPAAIDHVISELATTFPPAAAALHQKLRAYLANPVTEKILLKPIRAHVSEVRRAT
jgi:hypothetical protein